MNASECILIIEDDPAVASGLQDGLAREGYHVVWKSSGMDGIQHLRTHNPHLVILDVRLPDGSGFDFCRQIRQSGLRQPIMMLTVQQDEIDKVLGLEMGADDYMTKPFGLRELLSRVRALLRRAYGDLANTDANLLHVGDLVIDRGRGQVRRGNQIIVLTPTEFRLLVCLAQHSGQALSRDQIIDAVWGYDADPNSEKMVNVHIRRLREKIEADPATPQLILTVPGVGYRLVQN
ncbi:MAG: response regulator transcription factor [Anaerolineae bacterium]|nr:response regulator transcription factor [Anaerolineae bacterium]